MARITIELNTTESAEDITILRAVARAYDETGSIDNASEAYRAAVDAEGERAEPTTRKRRTKAEIAADEAAKGQGPSADASAQTDTPPASSKASDIFGGSATKPATDDGSVTLDQINALLTELLGPKHGATAAILQEIVKANSEGTATSPKFADPKFWPAIYSALKEVAG